MSTPTRPPVSVILPTYNRAALLPRALASALDQVAPWDEVIVVDDGSTDETPAVAAGFGERIKYVRVTNGGAGRARNLGVQESSRPLVAFLDSDDEWMPSKLDLQCGLMQARPDVVFSFSDIGVRFHWGSETRYFVRHRYKERLVGNRLFGDGVPYSSLGPLPDGVTDFLVHIGDLYHPEMAESHVATSTLVVRRDLAKNALYFAEDLPTYEDWECFGRLAARGKAAFLDHETAWLHRHEGGQLTDASALTSASARIAVLTRVWGSDPAYLSVHRSDYEATLREVRLARIRSLINLGRLREARRELRDVAAPPRSVWIASRLPRWALRRVLAARRATTED